MLTASLESPPFAAVTLVATPSASSSPSSPSPSTVFAGTLTLYLPHEVEATVSGLDANTLTLLLLELVWGN